MAAIHGQTARQVLTRDEADAIASGVLSIASRDLSHRLATGAPLNEHDPSTFCTSEPEGYTDDPPLDEGGHAAA